MTCLTCLRDWLPGRWMSWPTEEVTSSTQGGGGATVSFRLWTLLFCSGSSSAELAEEKAVISPTAVGLVTKLADTCAPLARSPSWHTVLAGDCGYCWHDPAAGMAETRSRPCGRVKKAPTPVAVSGPWFVTTSV